MAVIKFNPNVSKVLEEKIYNNLLERENKELIYNYSRYMGIQILPFDIKKYLINSGVEIIYEEMDNMSGYLKKKEESFLIGINKYQNEARQRFTMAHELAHIVLHSKGDGKKEFRDIILFRDSEKFDKKEIEANNFAGELLMPKDYFNDAIMNNINTCEKLAEHFNVSPAAARYRAYKLGYIGSY